MVQGMRDATGHDRLNNGLIESGQQQFTKCVGKAPDEYDDILHRRKGTVNKRLPRIGWISPEVQRGGVSDLTPEPGASKTVQRRTWTTGRVLFETTLRDQIELGAVHRGNERGVNLRHRLQVD
jgi:hypothetical protein